MTAQIIRFPARLSEAPPKTERQQQFDRVVGLLMARAAGDGNPCTEEKARAALTASYLKAFGRQPATALDR